MATSSDNAAITRDRDVNEGRMSADIAMLKQQMTALQTTVDEISDKLSAWGGMEKVILGLATLVLPIIGWVAHEIIPFFGDTPKPPTH